MIQRPQKSSCATLLLFPYNDKNLDLYHGPTWHHDASMQVADQVQDVILTLMECSSASSPVCYSCK